MSNAAVSFHYFVYPSHHGLIVCRRKLDVDRQPHTVSLPNSFEYICAHLPVPFGVIVRIFAENNIVGFNVVVEENHLSQALRTVLQHQPWPEVDVFISPWMPK